ncbi:MAG: hypothetical protein WA584_21620 [Pyrinomonadaceae bacterium]
MIYPKELKPTLSEIFQLSSNKRIEIPKANIHFEKWFDEKIEDTYGGKTIINFNDEAVFAELAILRIFENNGWSGVWVDTFRKKYRTDWINKNGVELSSDRQIFLNKIYKNLDSKIGCWDVFCWKEKRVIFVESKRQSKDKIRETQIRFLESALNCGLSKESFLIVEWTLA